MGRWNILFGEWPQTSEVGNWISLIQLAMPFSMRIVWFVVNNFPCLSFDSSKVSFCWAQRGRCKVAGMISGLYWCFLGLQSLSFRSFRHSLTCWVYKEFVRWEKFVFKEIWTDQKWTCLMPQKVWQGKRSCFVFCLPFNSAGKKPEGFFQGRVWQRCLWDPDLVCACQWRRAEEWNQRPMTGHNILVSICFNIGWSKVHLRSIRSIIFFVCPAASEFNDSMVRRWTTVCFGNLSISCPALLWLKTSCVGRRILQEWANRRPSLVVYGLPRWAHFIAMSLFGVW